MKISLNFSTGKSNYYVKLKRLNTMETTESFRAVSMQTQNVVKTIPTASAVPLKEDPCASPQFYPQETTHDFPRDSPQRKSSGTQLNIDEDTQLPIDETTEPYIHHLNNC